MKNISLERYNHTAVITVNHPPVNAWNLSTLKEFEATIDGIDQDGEVRVIIITGFGEKYFSAGFDIKDAANGPEISPKARALWRRIDRLEKPVIAAINGFTMGGGLELALSCHFRIMADIPEPVLGLTELNLGIMPGWGGTQRLTRVVGKAKALEMILFGRTVNAQEALKIGLINGICPLECLITEALAFAERLANKPPIAVSWVLKAISAGIYEDMDKGLTVEEDGSAAVRNTEDCREGFAAFLEKRKPVFKGR